MSGAPGVHILWQSRKIKSIFKLKDKKQHPPHVIYEDNCSCRESYIGETMHNVEVRTAEHNDPTHNSEPARHIQQNKSRKFSWKVIYPARRFFKRKILEGLFIQQRHPSLNKQINCYIAKLFPAFYSYPSGKNLSSYNLNTLPSAANCAQYPDDDFLVEIFLSNF